MSTPPTQDHRVTTVERLREIVPEPHGPALDKEIDHLDANCRAFIAHAPFVVMSTSDAEGNCNATPKGGPPGFVRVLDAHRLVIPDYPGNRRLDGVRDTFDNPRGHLLFLLPQRGETLRLKGDIWITDDPELLATIPDRGKVPKLGIGMTVHKAFLQCAKALRRSQLWEPEAWPDISEVPSSAQMFRDHIAMEDLTVERIDEILESDYRDEKLY